MWPCWFALTLVPIHYTHIIKWYILFLIGAFLMRSAGCIINDLVDINIDKKILRTANRPLTSKKISKIEAVIFLFYYYLLVFLYFYNLIFCNTYWNKLYSFYHIISFYEKIYSLASINIRNSF